MGGGNLTYTAPRRPRPAAVGEVQPGAARIEAAELEAAAAAGGVAVVQGGDHAGGGMDRRRRGRSSADRRRPRGKQRPGAELQLSRAGTMPEAERRRRVLQKPPGVRTAERQTKRGRGQMRGQFSAAEPDKC
jgi:hypothetical protein